MGLAVSRESISQVACFVDCTVMHNRCITGVGVFQSVTDPFRFNSGSWRIIYLEGEGGRGKDLLVPVVKL